MSDRELELNKRSLLKKTASTAAAGGLGLSATGVGAASSGEDEGPGWEFTGVEWLDQGDASTYRKYLMSQNWAGELKREMQSDGFRPKSNALSAARLKTTSSEVNAADPVQVFLPFAPRGGNSDDGMSGFMMATVAGQGSERSLLTAIASVVDRTGDEVTSRVYGNVGDAKSFEAGVVHSSVVNDPRFQQSKTLTCATCELVVGNICAFAGNSALGSICLKGGVLCAGAGGGVNIPAGLGCMGVCYLVIGTVKAYGCVYAPGFICKRVEEANC